MGIKRIDDLAENQYEYWIDEDDDDYIVEWHKDKKKWTGYCREYGLGHRWEGGKGIDENDLRVLRSIFGIPENVGLKNVEGISPEDLRAGNYEPEPEEEQPRLHLYKDFIRELISQFGVKEDSWDPFFRMQINMAGIAPRQFSLRRGFTGLGVIVNKEWALKFDKSERIFHEIQFYAEGRNFGFLDFLPRNKIGSVNRYTEDKKYGAMLLKNVYNEEPGSIKALKKYGFVAKNFLDYVIFMMGVMHKEYMPVLQKKFIYETEFRDILGKYHHKFADNPLGNLGHYNFHFFRDTAPSKESQKEIEYYNSWRKENLTCIIHGDIKPENVVNGHFVDPSQWGKGNELDELAYFLSNIRFYKGREWFGRMVDKYVHYRISHDLEFMEKVLNRKAAYIFDEKLRMGALQQQLALRDSVMKKRIIELHKDERIFYHHNLEELTSWMKNPKAHT